MSAEPSAPAWHGELVCATAAAHATVVRLLQHFLDSEDTELHIGENAIEELPPSYFAPAEVRARLKVFDCYYNNLTSLPAELGQLAALERFNCSYNALTSLPASLGQLSALKEFDCDHNRLT